MYYKDLRQGDCLYIWDECYLILSKIYIDQDRIKLSRLSIDTWRVNTHVYSIFEKINTRLVKVVKR